MQVKAIDIFVALGYSGTRFMAVRKPTLSLVLGVLNEEENLERVYKELITILENARITYELLFIESGSTDNSTKILKNLAKNDPNVSFFKVKINKAGYKVRKGFTKAKGKYIGVLCSDGQDDPAILPKAIDLLEKNKADIVKGTRTRRQGLIRLLVSICFNFLNRVLFGLTSNDINGHPRIMRQRDYEVFKLKSDNEFLDCEIMIKAREMNLVVVELQVKERKRETGKSSVNLRVLVGIIKEMFRYRFYPKYFH